MCRCLVFPTRYSHEYTVIQGGSTLPHISFLPQSPFSVPALLMWIRVDGWGPNYAPPLITYQIPLKNKNKNKKKTNEY